MKAHNQQQENHNFCRANLTNISAKFQLYSHNGFKGDDFLDSFGI